MTKEELITGLILLGFERNNGVSNRITHMYKLPIEIYIIKEKNYVSFYHGEDHKLIKGSNRYNRTLKEIVTLLGEEP